MAKLIKYRYINEQGETIESLKRVDEFECERIEELIPDEPPVDPFENLRNDIINKYKNVHTVNGRNFYETFRANLIIDINLERITTTDAFMIESYLGKVFDKISIHGDWKTAQYLISTLPDNLPVAKAYKDKAFLEINKYISLNYGI
jgi:hypothetical protein